MVKTGTNNSTHLILLAHGSRDPKWTETFEGLYTRLGNAMNVEQVSLAYLELAEPRLEHALDKVRESGATRIEILPLFFATGRHLREDVPAMLETYRQKHSALTLELLAPVGEQEAFTRVMVEIISGVLSPHDDS
jgi:sirohydrochlorin cobaltochelatase|tara:strand:- start:471 stop:875 length:405 start_codon:yes stop_codon:yes gene_type:complete